MRKETGDKVISAANRTDSGSEGLPIGVQIAAPPGQEGHVLNVMALLEAHCPCENRPPVYNERRT